MNQSKLQKRERIIFVWIYTVLLFFWGISFFSRYNLKFYSNFYPIPLTMIFGSFLGGFTCEGGGAVAFPVFTKLLGIQPYIARDFSFAIQSIGMTFASLTILLRKIPIEKNVIICASIGGSIGIVIGTCKIVPMIAPQEVKLIFTLLITSFGIALFLKNFTMKSWENKEIFNFSKLDALILVSVGFIGGIFSSIIGTGVHFITFSIVTLLYKLDEKIATPSSIIIMAVDAIIGFTLRVAILKEFSEQAIIYWWLCIPIVAFFAPLGAIMCSKVNRLFIVKFLLLLIIIEFTSTLIIYQLNTTMLLMSLIVIFLSLTGYIYLINLSNQYISRDYTK